MRPYQGSEELQQYLCSIKKAWGAKGHGQPRLVFNVLEDAEALINEIWSADIPVFAPDTEFPSGPVFLDARPVADTLRTLAELVYYSKKKAQGPLPPGADEWIKASFAGHSPEKFLPGLQPVLERFFPELIEGAHEVAAGVAGNLHGAEYQSSQWSRWSEHQKHKSLQNYFYIPDYRSIPDALSLEAFMKACGIRESERPDNHDFLMQTYHRSLVRLERLIALSHLMIAGAQSETTVSRETLEREYELQERLKELKASYLAEHSTMRLAFAKRHRGMHMLKKLNDYSAFESKHELALKAIGDRLSIGTEQYPTIVNATQRMQRVFFGIGQVLLGGFLATEVIKAVAEWSAVLLHRDHYAFFARLAKLMPGAPQAELTTLQHEYHAFELAMVCLSVTTVAAVVGITVYYKLKNKALHGEGDAHSSHHH